MDLGITGIIDILIIVCGLLVMLIGYLRGFMNKALTLVGLVLMFVVAILFCGQLAGFFKSTGFIYNDLYNTCLTKVSAEGVLSERFAVTVEKAFGIHAAIATIIAFVFGNPAKNMTAEQTSDVIAFKVTVVISFLIIFFLLAIVLVILKIITAQIRENKVIKKIDGIFGIFLYLCLYAIALMGIFFVLDLIYRYGGLEGFNHWLETDLALNSNKFRIGKNLLQNNYLVAIINLFIK